MGSISDQNSHQSSTSGINPKFMPYALDALKRGEDVGNQGYVPYMGMDVAVPDSKIAAWQSAADRSAAFNTPGQAAQDIRSQMPLTTQNGVQGLSSYAGYQDQLSQLQQNYPALYDYIKSFSIDPVTGAMGSRTYGHGTGGDGNGGGGGGGGNGQGNTNRQTMDGSDIQRWYFTKNRDFITPLDLYNNTYGTKKWNG